MKKLSPFSYCNFFKLEFLLSNCVPVNHMGAGFFGQFWPDNPQTPPPPDILASFGWIIRPETL
jgi:hypothetical protein